MTADHSKSLNKRSHVKIYFGRYALAVGAIILLLIMLINNKQAITDMREGLSVCAKTLIPSLFPFMVISEIMISADVMRLPFDRFFKRLLGINSDAAAASLLGMICGFPIGARCASSLYAKGRITRTEYLRMLTLSCNPSPAFMIGAVGISAFGSKKTGITLYIICILSALAVTLAITHIFGGKERLSPAPLPVAPPSASDKSLAVIFTDAVRSSAVSMLYVCAFVVFFGTLTGSTEGFTAELPDWSGAIISGFFELTGGITRASNLNTHGIYVAALVSGWSGLSVHFQIMSICGKDGISFAPYILAKLAEGLLCIVLAVAATVVGII